MKECEIEAMKRKKSYERAEAEAAALAKVEEEEEGDKKHMPDCLDDIPSKTDKEVCASISGSASYYLCLHQCHFNQSCGSPAEHPQLLF